MPDAFIRDKGIVVVPAEEVRFKERVKNDIVLVEAVPEFKPTVVNRDYEDEGRLREERVKIIDLLGFSQEHVLILYIAQEAWKEKIILVGVLILI